MIKEKITHSQKDTNKTIPNTSNLSQSAIVPNKHEARSSKTNNSKTNSPRRPFTTTPYQNKYAKTGDAIPKSGSSVHIHLITVTS